MTKCYNKIYMHRKKKTTTETESNENAYTQLTYSGTYKYNN